MPGFLSALKAAKAQPYDTAVLLKRQAALGDDSAACDCCLLRLGVKPHLQALLQEAKDTRELIFSTLCRRLVCDVR